MPENLIGLTQVAFGAALAWAGGFLQHRFIKSTRLSAVRRDAYAKWAAAVEATLSSHINYAHHEALWRNRAQGVPQEPAFRQLAASELVSSATKCERTRCTLDAARYRLLLLDRDKRRRSGVNAITERARVCESVNIDEIPGGFDALAKEVRLQLREFVEHVGQLLT